MNITTEQLTDALKKHFGYNSFKGTQEAVIESLLSGKDTFVIMPTGGGKSLCYQLPALLCDGTAIVISPLIALMKNQVDQLRTFHSDDRVAHFLNSSLSKKQSRQVKEDITNGLCKILYVAPETLVKQESIDFFNSVKISFVAVDEAHCISEWGHDFRPEYRRIKEMIKALGESIPIIALTATATPKVQQDIVKNLGMGADKRVFVSSFLRDNLHYEVRPKGKKENIVKQLVQFIKQREGQSGVIYALNRKTTEEVAELLVANGVNAVAYHAGLEGGVRAKVQDAFLMDDVDVICATIAFGMGIDKPDVRYVIHYDIPKSLENYYQETGRAGRDGIDGHCLAFFSFKDINKLEKFLKDKPVAEKEVAGQHLMEVVSYAESTVCRRKFLLHYFGETYIRPEGGCGHCDNCKNPKERLDVQEDALKAIAAVRELNENYTIPYLVDVISGKATQQIKAYKHDQVKSFGVGKDQDKNYWNSVLRNMLIEDVLNKDIEKYGIIKLTPKAEDFVKKPEPFFITVNNDYQDADDVVVATKTIALDEELVKQLLDLRKKIAKEHQLPPAVIFLETSINDMATQYPLTNEEMANITGVSVGKSQKYGKPFLELIQAYVEENDIDRPQDFVVKSSAKKGGNKIKIIQQIDKKLPFEEIEKNLNLNRAEFLEELETIVGSGTKLDINYYVEEQVDEESVEIIMDYFSEAETLDLKQAAEELLEEEDIPYEEVELVRIKFYSDVAN